MSVTWFEDPAAFPYVRAVMLFVGRYPQWSWGWREVARNDTHSFITCDHDTPHYWLWALPSEAVDPTTIGDEGRGRRTARCLGGRFPELPARVRERRKAYLRARTALARLVERHLARMAA